MKTFRISKYYVGIYILGSIFILLGFALGVYSVIQWVNWWLAWAMLLIPMLGILFIAYQLLFDFQSGTFSVNDHGITMNIAFRKWFHAWEDIQECDIIGISVGDGRTFWVYFSDRHLLYQEKDNFLRKTRKDLKHIAFFQYNNEILQEIYPLIPSKYAEIIKAQANHIESQMTRTEKLYHK